MRYFPAPYPDEILGSLLIRACHHLGLSPRALIHYLGDGLGDLSFVYPSFFRGISQLTRIPVEILLAEHTVFPYVAIGMTLPRRRVLESDWLAGTARGNSVRLRAALGLHIDELARRRYCQKCCDEDYRHIGESYWHRRHMLPGVFICHKHGEPLLVTNISVLIKLTNESAKLPQEATGHPYSWGLDEKGMRYLAAAVEEVMSLPAQTSDDRYAGYRALASSVTQTRKYTDGDVDPMLFQFCRFYGTEFLRKMGLSVQTFDSDGWPSRMMRGDCPPVHRPLRHILLWLFLHSSRFSLQSKI